MNCEIDVRDVLPVDPRADARPASAGDPDSHVEAGALHRRAASRARASSSSRATTTCPGSATPTRSLDEIEEFLTGVRRGAASSTGCSRRCSSPTSSARPSAPPSSAIARWRELLERHHAVVRARGRALRGREVERPATASSRASTGPARAIRCACAIGDAVDALGLDVRAGVHTGEVELRRRRRRRHRRAIGARVAALARRPARCSCRGRSRIWSSARDLGSPTRRRPSCAAFRACGRSMSWWRHERGAGAGRAG